jgi:DNA-binding NarL/FixJ family response regulator
MGSDSANRIRVQVVAVDPLDAAGVGALIASCPEFELLDRQQVNADVVVVVAESDRAHSLDPLRAIANRTGARLVLVGDGNGLPDLLGAARLGLAAILPRAEISAERLCGTIRTVHRGGAELPSAQQGRLLAQIGRLQRDVLDPRGLSVHGLDNREIDVLRLLADGFSTRDIADKLSYSERTVKNILHLLTGRLRLRNRTHAVAFAIRAGAI